MTPLERLAHLSTKTPTVPLKISEFETISNWSVWLESTQFTLEHIEPTKRSYHTALSGLLKVWECLDEKEDDT